MTTFEVRHRADEERYILLVDGHAAGELTYRERGDARVLIHTEVLPELEGRGLGSMLAQRALDDAAAAGSSVVPRCSFVAAFIDEHPEYRALLAT